MLFILMFLPNNCTIQMVYFYDAESCKDAEGVRGKCQALGRGERVCESERALSRFDMLARHLGAFRPREDPDRRDRRVPGGADEAAGAHSVSFSF